VACVAHVSRGYDLLKAAIDELARRFATTSAGGTGRQRLRERTDDLVLDLLAVLKTASLAEIAEMTRALERRRKTRVSARSTSLASASQSGSSRRGQNLGEAEEPRARADEKPPAAPRNPFDITVPSELLEPAKTSGGALRDAPRTPRKQTSDLMGLSAAAGPSAPIEQPPHRSVSLREGEQLLRTGGGGAIIRRVRGS
jgi:hypothetical protein